MHTHTYTHTVNHQYTSLEVTTTPCPWSWKSYPKEALDCKVFVTESRYLHFFFFCFILLSFVKQLEIFAVKGQALLRNHTKIIFKED